MSVKPSGRTHPRCDVTTLAFALDFYDLAYMQLLLLRAERSGIVVRGDVPLGVRITREFYEDFHNLSPCFASIPICLRTGLAPGEKFYRRFRRQNMLVIVQTLLNSNVFTEQFFQS